MTLFFTHLSHAACTTPAGTEGEFKITSGKFTYCNGTSWVSDSGTASATPCSTGQKIETVSNNTFWCNGSFLHYFSNLVSLGSCSLSGKIQYNSVTKKMEVCQGATLYSIESSDPCWGKSIGDACGGTSALYLGSYSSKQYMVTPSGCGALNGSGVPTCSGSDSLTQQWLTSTTDIPQIDNTASPSGDSHLGSYNTTILKTNGSAAGTYCEDMVYGGFSDWYAPNVDEAQLLLTAGGLGAAGLTSSYWTSTERDGVSAWVVRIPNTDTVGVIKTATYRVRCVRSY